MQRPSPLPCKGDGCLFKIVAAVDRSRYASVVMETVLKVASHVESDVTILTAVKPKRYRSQESAGEDEEVVAEYHKDLVRRYFPAGQLALGPRMNRDPMIIPAQSATVHTRIIEGDPADVVCHLAESVDADLVVVGKRGGGNMGSMLLGSVSEKVVHKCTRSVLVAKREKPPHTDRDESFVDLEGISRSMSR